MAILIRIALNEEGEPAVVVRATKSYTGCGNSEKHTFDSESVLALSTKLAELVETGLKNRGPKLLKGQGDV